MTDEESLLPALFSGTEHPLELLLYFLYKHNSPGVQAFLINRLYEVPIEKVIEFLPQLVNLSTQKTDYIPYASFFLDTSIKSHVFAMKLYWMMQAQSYDGPKRYSPAIVNILRDLERVIVNGQKQMKDVSIEPPHLFQLDISDSEDDLFSHKRARADYFNDQHQLAQTLGKISISLIDVPNEDKDTVLASQIQEVDQWVKNTRSLYDQQEGSLYVKRLYRGIVLPLEFFGEIPYSEQIVNIPSTESICFKTKARVPYKIIVETIDINEDEVEMPKRMVSNDILNYNNDEVQDKNLQFGNYGRWKIENREIETASSISKDSESPWGESWEETKTRIRLSSTFGHFKSWKIRPLIIKGHDDLRQELLAMQIINKCDEIFKKSGLSIFLRPYNILVVSHNSGFIECIPDAISMHAIKKNTPNYTDLQDFFTRYYRGRFLEAQKNFVESMAGYSLICYILNLKDRHNGNILLDSKGHIIHIDFGFFLTNAPGGNMGFESAPFKLTKEMIDLMGGYDHEMFMYFRILFYQGFLALRKHLSEMILLIEMMKPGDYLNCMRDPEKALKEFRHRFKLNLSEDQCLRYIDKLVEKSAENWKTVKYDSFQRVTNGIL